LLKIEEQLDKKKIEEENYYSIHPFRYMLF